MKTIINKVLLIIVTLTVTLIFSCDMNPPPSDGHGGEVSKPPSSSPGGTVGVWVDSNGDLRINAPLYVFGHSGPPDFESTLELASEGTVVGMFVHDENTMDALPIITTIVDSNGMFDITIPADILDYDSAAEAFAFWDGINPDAIITGANVQVGFLNLRVVGLGYNNPEIFLSTADTPDLIMREGFMYLYSQGNVRIIDEFEIETIMSDEPEQFNIDIWLTSGWNILSICLDKSFGPFYQISASPPSNARWVTTSY